MSLYLVKPGNLSNFYLNKVLCISWYVGLCSIFNIVYKINKLAKRNSTCTKGCKYKLYTTMQPGGVQTFSWFYTLLAFHINSYKIWTKNLTIWEKLLYTCSKFFSGEKANIKQVFQGESSHWGKLLYNTGLVGQLFCYSQ